MYKVFYNNKLEEEFETYRECIEYMFEMVSSYGKDCNKYLITKVK